MTKNEIISELFISKDFNNCIGKMKPVSLQDELKAEVALILCEKSEDVILDLYNKGGLKFYTVRIILNLIQSNTSPFYKKFRVNHVDISLMLKYGHWDSLDSCSEDELYNTSSFDRKHFISAADGSNYDDRKDKAIDEIETLYWYDREILKLYGKYGTYRKVEEETGIPFESIYKTVQRACKEIRKKVA